MADPDEGGGGRLEGEHFWTSPAFPARIAGIRDGHIIVLSPDEVRYAEADGHTVWLETDHGRLRAAIRGFNNVEKRLSPLGFLRIHRRYIVNIARITAVDRVLKAGGLKLSTDVDGNESIPVSRRNVALLRRAVGI